MPSASSQEADPDDVLTAERDHLRCSRDFLERMRTDVLSLRAMGGDPVSEEYLKADLHHRAEALKDLPDTPLFFGRLDYRPGALAGLADGAGPAGSDRLTGSDGLAGRDGRPGDEPAQSAAADGDEPTGESFHVGRRHVHDPQGSPVVIDWRAPVSRPFYRASQGESMGLERRRRFG